MTDEAPKKNKGGGRQPGSGRKKGVPNKITLAARKRALAMGDSSLEVMTELMLWARDTWRWENNKRDRDEQAVMEKWDAALRAAEKLAPYMHSKAPVAVRHSGGNGGPIQSLDLSKLTDEQLAALEPVISALAAAGGLAGADPEGEGTAEA